MWIPLLVRESHLKLQSSFPRIPHAQEGGFGGDQAVSVRQKQAHTPIRFMDDNAPQSKLQVPLLTQVHYCTDPPRILLKIEKTGCLISGLSVRPFQDRCWTNSINSGGTLGRAMRVKWACGRSVEANLDGQATTTRSSECGLVPAPPFGTVHQRWALQNTHTHTHSKRRAVWTGTTLELLLTLHTTCLEHANAWDAMIGRNWTWMKRGRKKGKQFR